MEKMRVEKKIFGVKIAHCMMVNKEYTKQIEKKNYKRF